MLQHLQTASCRKVPNRRARDRVRARLDFPFFASISLKQAHNLALKTNLSRQLSCAPLGRRGVLSCPVSISVLMSPAILHTYIR